MYRKMFTGMICLMLLAGIFFVPKVRPTYQNKKNHRDCQRTHSGSWESASRRHLRIQTAGFQ